MPSDSSKPTSTKGTTHFRTRRSIAVRVRCRLRVLSPAIESAARRRERRRASGSLASRRQREEVTIQKTVTDRFILTTSIKPRVYHAKNQKSQFDGPMARRDAEEAGSHCLKNPWEEQGEPRPHSGGGWGSTQVSTMARSHERVFRRR